MHLKGRHWLVVWLLLFLCVLRRHHDAADRGLPHGARGCASCARSAWRSRRDGPSSSAGSGSRRAGRCWSPSPSARSAFIEPGDSEFVLFALPGRGPGQDPDGQAGRADRRDPVRLRPRPFWPWSGARRSSRSFSGSGGPARPSSKRTERVGAARATRCALRSQRRAARHDPGVLPRRRRAERAGGHPRRASCCWCGTSASPRRRSTASSRRRKTLDLSARPVQRHAGAAAPRREGDPPRPATSSASILRATSPGRSSAGSIADRSARGRRTRAVARFDPDRPPGRGGLPQGPGGPPVRVAEPRWSGSRWPGNDVTLTLDAELQEIAERGLDDALAETQGRGRGRGVSRSARPASCWRWPRARRRPGARPRASTFTDPFEPGSTAKLFTAAALLMRDRVESTDAVFAENGVWLMPVSRTGTTRRIHDTHKSKGKLTLAQAIQVSSNIAMAKFSSPAHARGAVRDAARLRLRDSDRLRSSPRSRAGILARPGPVAADVHARQHGDGLRDRRDAGAAGGGLRRDRQRRGAALRRRWCGRSGIRPARCCTATSPSRSAG